MRKLSSLAALAIAGMAAFTAAISDSMPSATQPPSRKTRESRSYRRIGNGYRYPEQSSRQALRLHRRAQGGHGLMFTGTGYEPKAKFDDYLPR